jgi:hypothetical protein
MRPEALVQCGRMGLDPTVAGGVVDGSTAVGEHGLEPAAADREPQAPARRPQDALGREPPALARVRPAARHAAALLVGVAGSTRSQPVGRRGSGASWHSVPFGKAARAIRRVSSGIGYPSSACNDIDLSSMSGQCRGSLMEGGRALSIRTRRIRYPCRQLVRPRPPPLLFSRHIERSEPGCSDIRTIPSAAAASRQRSWLGRTAWTAGG